MTEPRRAFASLPRQFLILTLSLAAAAGPLCAFETPVPPKREVRAVWITTVGGLDWPKSQSRDEQQRSLREMVERLDRAHFNTIFFQARGRGDVFYRSALEPWSNVMTGTLGDDPGWDPLAFLLDEAHSRGIEVHAWFNTFLVRTGKAEPPLSEPRHVILSHPKWVRLVETEWWLDPGIPEVRDYTLRLVMELVSRYDIDGIQFDFIRYPVKPYPDDATYRRYGGRQQKDDWRRENITRFLQAVYDSVTGLRPWVKVGSTPIGIYRNTEKFRGLQSYADLYQDSRAWVAAGAQDYLVPQVYWSTGATPGDPDFTAVVEDWSRNANGRQVVIGLGPYKPEVRAELPELIDITRRYGLGGTSCFRYENIADMLTMGGRYSQPALIPPMPWKDPLPPNPPTRLVADQTGGSDVHLRWTAPTQADDGDHARRIVVYRSPRQPVDVSSLSNIAAILAGTDTAYVDTISRPVAPRYFYALTSLDRANNESTPTVPRGVVVPAVAELSRLFNPALRIGTPFITGSVLMVPYELPERTPVIIKLLDRGNAERVSVVDQVQPGGRYVAAADVSGLRDGEYTCLVVAGGRTERSVITLR